jgi:transcriptional regulator with XRE-family HTH domain
MTQAKAKPLKLLIGRRLRELRKSFGLSQDQMAARARRWGGLNWTRSALAKIERGERSITLEEFLILPIVYKNTRLDQLIPASEDWTSLTPQAAVKVDVLRKLLSGIEPGRLHPADTDLPELRKVGKVIRQLSIGETERRAARSLNVAPTTLARRAHQLWGMSLADERERRLLAQLAPKDWAEAEVAESSPRARALRGHITRDLRQELDKVFSQEDRR